jgi:hypothetical protein
LATIWGSPESKRATHELVVPRSIPMTLPTAGPPFLMGQAVSER